MHIHAHCSLPLHLCLCVFLQAPLSGTNNMTLCCMWCASGPITVTASAEKKAFVPGTVSIHPPIYTME